jgi:DNA polymerase I-like protein with 3'-5' exonuclease and polymerase domains
LIYVIGKSSKFESSTIEECLAYFKDKNIIQVDTETEGNKRNPELLPNPWESKVLSLQLGDYDNQFVIVPEAIDLNLLKPIFENPNIVKIFTNASFDLRFLFHWGWNVRNVYDCFLVEKILNRGLMTEKGYLGLGAMVKRYTDGSLSKDVRGQINWRGLDDIVIEYAAMDVKYMEIIRDKQMERIRKLNQERYVRLENAHIISLARISYNGFKVNKEKWLEYAKMNEKRLVETENELDNYVITKKFSKYIETQLSLFSSDLKTTINWNSSDQVIPLFEDLGINILVPDKDKGGMKKSLDGKQLERQANKFDILPIYLKYKEIAKEVGTYGESFINDHYNPVTGRIHTEFFPILDTGRISSSRPNMQNIPAIDDEGNPHPLRKCFEAEEGNNITVCDFSGQEARILADKSQDKLLLDLFLIGDGDTHSIVGTTISPFFFGSEIQVSRKNNPMVEGRGKRIRDIGKIINFKLAFGGTAFTLKDDLDCTQEEAQKIIDLIVNKFVQQEAYFKRCHKFIEQNGYIITDEVTNARSYYHKYGRYLELKAMPYEQRTKAQVSEFFKLRGEMQRLSQNYPIQGTAGVITKTAIVIFDANCKGLGKIVMQVHDEIVAESKKENTEFVAECLKVAMIEAGKIFCKSVPMEVEPGIGNNWGAKT